MLEQFINEIPSEYRDKINETCTDLHSSSRPVLERCLPNAILTADRFHVETLARRTLDAVRSIVQEERAGNQMNMKKIL